MARRSRTSASSHSRARASAPRRGAGSIRAAISSSERSPSRSSRSCRRSGLVARCEPSSACSCSSSSPSSCAVEQLAQLRLAEQLAQLRLVDGQGLGAPLGERRVAVVEVVGDVAEEQRRREGRRRLRVDGDQPDLALAHAARQLDEAGQVEDVLQALAEGLEHDRERRVARGHLQQVVRALPLHPERRALARPPARQEQRARRRLAEARREEARAAQLADHELLDLLGLGKQLARVGRPLALRQPDHDPVVAPDRLDLLLARLAQLRLERHRPGRVDPAAPRREQAQPPVAHLVAGPLEHDRAVVGQRAGRLALLLEVGDEVLGGARVEVVLALAGARSPARAASDASSRVSRPIAPPELDRAARRDPPSRTASCRARPARAAPARGRA